MPLSDIISISITTQTSSLSQEGFGMPMVLGAHAHNSDRIRFYSSLSAMVSDGFLTTDPEYIAAQRLFGQTPRPPQIAIGRRANRPTQRFALTPTVLNSTLYGVEIDGKVVEYTSDASATEAEIIAGLTTAAGVAGVSGITFSDQSTYLRALASAVGAFHSVKVRTPTVLAVAQDHAANDPAADLDAIKLVDNSWYGLVSVFNSEAEILAIAAWAEANKKIFVAQSQDSDTLTTSTTDVFSDLEAASYKRSVGIYSAETDDFADAAWLGSCLPLQPGSETWKFKTLAGVPVVNLTETQQTNLRNKHANYYVSVGGRGITQEGYSASGDFIDTTRGVDWFEARLMERLALRLFNASKIPMDDSGIAIVEAEIRAQLQEGIDVGFLAASPEPTVIVPRAADISDNDKALRQLTGVSFDAVIAGAVHKVVLSGTISV